MDRVSLVRLTGLLLIFLVIVLNIPYIVLMQTFEYDDILREPVDYVLTQFQAGGASLIMTWFVFGIAALLFIPVSLLLHKILSQENTPYLVVATVLGILSGILQSIGLLRWVFVVPILAQLYTEPSASTAIREAVSVVYQAIHQFGGVAIGEFLGQMLLVFWTLGVAVAMRGSPLFKSWIPWLGLMSLPLLLLGQSELLKTVISTMPVFEFTPLGFILWEFWLFIVGISLLRVPRQRLVSKLNLS